MTTKPNTRLTDHASYVQAIIKHLERLTHTGYRAEIVFRDWLSLLEANLKALPLHLKAIQETGHVAPPEADTPDTQKLFAQLRERYTHQDDWVHLSDAMALLIASTGLGYYDVLGDVYMQFAAPNLHQAQFFTPWPIAQMMAQITCTNAQEMLLDRLKDAARKAITEDPLLEALLFATGITAQITHSNNPAENDPWLSNVMHEMLLPKLVPYFEPIKILDPCVGSGVMLLAVAKQFPHWAIRLGLVQFYGQDLDPDCVQMCRLNCMLYGLNGWGVKVVFEATADELDACPEPTRSFYQTIKAEYEKGNYNLVDTMKTHATQVRNGMVAQQVSLFDVTATNEATPQNDSSPTVVDDVTQRLARLTETEESSSKTQVIPPPKIYNELAQAVSL